jgi:isocitrate dehydrogenase
VGAQIAGSVGLAGSANIGEHCAMFEAIHGSAPRRAGQDLANPSGLMLAAVQMLVHLGRTGAAERFHNAWLKTIEDGIHTYDIFDESVSTKKVGTKAFAKAVIERLGQKPVKLAPVSYAAGRSAPAGTIEARPKKKQAPKPVKRLVGVDVFLDWDKPGRDASALATELQLASAHHDLRLKMITNRGVKVWPEGFPETFCTDHWRCRFVHKKKGETVTHGQIVSLLTAVSRQGLDFIKTEQLCEFDGKAGYSKGQGE